MQFEWILDLALHITYILQHSILLNTEKKYSGTTKYNESVKEKYDNKFEQQILMDILNNIRYDHMKTEEL